VVSHVSFSASWPCFESKRSTPVGQGSPELHDFLRGTGGTSSPQELVWTRVNSCETRRKKVAIALRNNKAQHRYISIHHCISLHFPLSLDLDCLCAQNQTQTNAYLLAS
jgi:hypothetical protein